MARITRGSPNGRGALVNSTAALSLDPGRRYLRIKKPSRSRKIDLSLLTSVFPDTVAISVETNKILLRFPEALDALKAKSFLEMTMEFQGAGFALYGEECLPKGINAREIEEVDDVDDAGDAADTTDTDMGTVDTPNAVDPADTVDNKVDKDSKDFNRSDFDSKDFDSKVDENSKNNEADLDAEYGQEDEVILIQVPETTTTTAAAAATTTTVPVIQLLQKNFFDMTRKEKEIALYGPKLQERQKEFEREGNKGLVGLFRYRIG